MADTGSPSYVAEAGDGDEVAARLGVEIAARFDGGAHGTAFLLADDRVLKITHRAGEAVLALLLLERQAAGSPVPGFPLIHGVHRMHASVEVNDTLYATTEYAIVREEAGDIGNGWPGGNDGPHWTHAMGAVRRARRDGDRTLPDLGPAAHCAGDVEEVVDIVERAARELDATILDIRTSNLGRTEDGRLVIRDFDPETLPERVMALREGIPTIPDLEPARVACMGSP